MEHIFFSNGESINIIFWEHSLGNQAEWSENCLDRSYEFMLNFVPWFQSSFLHTFGVLF